MPIFPVRNHSAGRAYSTRAYGLAYGLTYGIARAGPAGSVWLSVWHSPSMACAGRMASSRMGLLAVNI